MNIRAFGLLSLVIASLVFPSLGKSETIGKGTVPQHAEWGRIDRYTIYSPQLKDSVVIETLLPEGYDNAGQKKYPVIYAHDGQNLYDCATTWNGQSWELDRALRHLADKGLAEIPIIVGIHSDPGLRVADLMPQKAISSTTLQETLQQVKLNGSQVRGDAYLDFIVETLKPEIDNRYYTLSDRENTAVMGSSMGGLMSVYAICEHPEVFGTALCLSTHWIGSTGIEADFSNSMINYIKANLPNPENHKLYFDHGTETLDEYYEPYNQMVIDMLIENGYSEESGNLYNKIFESAAHDEASWSRRADVPIKFFKGNNHR